MVTSRVQLGFCNGSKDAGGDQGHSSVHIALGFFFALNLVLCTGYLGMPFAFYHTGIPFAAATLVVVMFVGWNCAIWTVETMSRAQAMSNYVEWKNKLGMHFHLEELLHDKIQELEQQRAQHAHLSTRKFEPSELCEMFVGRWLKCAYILILIAFTFLVSPGYASIAASAWAVNMPINSTVFDQCTDEDFNEHILPNRDACRNTYWLCLCLFACVVVPLSLIEPKEQTCIQVLFGVLRFGVFVSMVVHCLVMLLSGNCSWYYDSMPEEESNCTNFSSYHGSINSKISLLTHFDWRSWLSSVPFFVFSVLMHQAIPSLTHPVKQKNYLRGYFNALFISVGIIFVSLGVLVALCFKGTINESAILNWDDTTAAAPGNSLVLQIVSYYIILFPSIDVCSVYPLVIMAMVNNIFTVIFGKESNVSRGHSWRHWILRTMIRIVCAFLPIVVAMWISNLAYILQYAGLIGIFICFFFPIVLQLCSQRVCCEAFQRLVDLKDAEGASRDKGYDSVTYESSNGELISVVDCHSKSSLIMSCTQSVLVEESLPLLSAKNTTTWSRWTCPTPYSTVFSHPVCVVGIGLLAIGFFLASVASIFVSPL